MNLFIFLVLLCSGLISAAPKVDQSLDSQSNLWMITPGAVYNKDKDTINNATVEESPKALEKDNQEQSEEEQGNSTAMNPFGYVKLRMKTSGKLFGLIKGLKRKGLLGKTTKRFGKKTLGRGKIAQTLGKTGKHIGKKILGEIVKPENVVDIVYGIGKEIVERQKTQESLTTTNGDLDDMSADEFSAEGILTPETRAQIGENISVEVPSSVDSGEEDDVNLQ